MAAPMPLTAAWAPTWHAAAQGTRAYLGSFLRFLLDQGIDPDEVCQRHFESWSATQTGRNAEIGYLNAVVAKFNLLTYADGTRLPQLARLPNRHDHRAAENDALPADVRDEIARTHDFLARDGDYSPKTIDAVERRLLEVARHPLVGRELGSFRDLAEPARLARYVNSFEDDPDALQPTVQTSRTRQLQDVARTLAICGFDAEAAAIEHELATHAKHSLAPADSTQAKLAAADKITLDGRRHRAIIDAITAFSEEQGR